MLAKNVRSILSIILLVSLLLSGCVDGDDSYDTSATTETFSQISQEETTADHPTEPSTAPTAEPTTAPTTEPPHIHSFRDATCTQPKTCTCGTTDGDANGHTWEDATCETPKTCAICGVTNGFASAHNYTDGTCSVCGANDPDYGSESRITYVLNLKSMKFHYLSCKKLPTKNRQDTAMSREEIIEAGYEPCGLCHP